MTEYTPTHPFAIGLLTLMKENGIKGHWRLHQATGLPLTTCRNIFQKGYTGPDWLTLKALADYFGQTPAYFLKRLEKKYAQNKHKKSFVFP